MNFTGKSRSILGPAEVSAINPSLTPDQAAEFEARQQNIESQFRTIERADGTLYMVPTYK